MNVTALPVGINGSLAPWNSSDSLSVAQETAHFKVVIDYLLLGMLISIMLSMGCEITWRQLVNHTKKPIGIVIGMLCQFGVMPLSAFSLMQAINVNGLYATGVLIISCCPGGVSSNAFSYFCDGDLSLSVAMTFFSTLLAMGMMPLNVWLYGRSLETVNLVIPYSKLALSLVSISSPVVVGMLLRWKCPKAAHYITKAGSTVGILFVVVCIVLEVIAFPDMFTGVPGKLYGTVLALPMIGITFGFILSSILRQSMAIRKTIAIECGIQNVPTALAIITLSFPVEMQAETVLLPWLYGFAMLSSGIIICLTYQVFKKMSVRREMQKKKAANLSCQEGGNIAEFVAGSDLKTLS